MRTLARVQGPSLSTSIAGGGTIGHFGMQEPSSRLPALVVLFPVPGVCFPGGWGTLLSALQTQSLLWPCSPSRGCLPCAHCPKPRVWQPAMHAEGVGSGGVARQHRCDSALVQARPASWGVGWLTLRARTSCLPSLDQPVAQSHPVC